MLSAQCYGCPGSEITESCHGQTEQRILHLEIIRRVPRFLPITEDYRQDPIDYDGTDCGYPSRRR